MKYLFLAYILLALLQCSEAKHKNQVEAQNASVVLSSDETSYNIIDKTEELHSIKPDCYEKLIEAIHKNDTILLSAILKNGCELNKIAVTGHNYYANDSTYSTPLSISGQYGITKILLQYGADPNINLGDRSPLELAVMQHKNDIVKLLIEKGANVNHFNKFTDYQSPIITAVSTGNLEALEMLIENGAEFKPNEKNVHNSLHKAIRHKQFEIAEFLIKNGVNTRTKVTPVNFEGEFGDCVPCPFEIEPIHSAVQLTDTALAINFIDLLISNNADVNAMNKNRQTPLSYIAASGDSAIAKHLISKGAIVDNVSVIRAARYHNEEYLKVLLNNGGDPNGNENKVTSPLSQAVLCCGDGFNNSPVESRINTVSILLENGAKPSKELLIRVNSEDRLKPISAILEQYGY